MLPVNRYLAMNTFCRSMTYETGNLFEGRSPKISIIR
jgi:hypothetical protein